MIKVENSEQTKRYVLTWVEQASKGSPKIRRTVLAMGGPGGLSLRELIKEERWDEALAAIRRIQSGTYW